MRELVGLNKEREAWIDNVKMTAMLFVILGHTWRVIHCPLPFELGHFILSFNMALFVIMTGYTSVKALERIKDFHSLLKYVLKITKRVIVPSIVTTMAVGVLMMAFKYILIGEFSFLKFGAKILFVLVFCVAFYIRNKKNGAYLFDALCVLSIPIALKLNMFWFFNMIWAVCITAAIAVYIHKKYHAGGGYFFVVYLGLCDIKCNQLCSLQNI